MKTYRAFTDGSCKPNPGIGGFAIVIVNKEGQVTAELSDAEENSTNNRMELMAVIAAIRIFSNAESACIISDSKYVINTINKGWKRHKNKDLWEIFDKELASSDCSLVFAWVKGHADNVHNNRADLLAQRAADDLRRQIDGKL